MFPEEQKVNHKQKFLDITLKVLSYLLAATVGAAAVVALFLNAGPVKQDPGLSKLEELQALIEERFIGEADAVVMEDAAAEAMIESKGFREAYVRMDDDTVDVVVDKETLTDAEVAQIEDIVKRKTGMDPSKIRINTLQK